MQRQQSSRHGIARGVIAADNEQNEVAHVFEGAHVPGAWPVGQHRNQVGAWRFIDPFVPETREVLQHLAQFGRMHLGFGRIRIGELFAVERSDQ